MHATIREDVQTGRPNTSLTVGTANIVQALNLLTSQMTESYVLTVPDDVRFSDGFFDPLEAWIAHNSAFVLIGCPVTNRHHNDDAVTLVDRAAI